MPNLTTSTDIDAFLAAANNAAARTALGVAPAAVAINDQTATAGNYTLVLTDANKLVLVPSTSDIVFPPNAGVAFPTGTVVWCLALPANSSWIPTAGAGVTLLSPTNAGNATRVIQGDMVLAVKIGTNTWNLSTAPWYQFSLLTGLTGVLSSDGAGNFAALAVGTDLLAPNGDGSALTGMTPAQFGAGILAANMTLGEATGQLVLDPALSADGKWSGIMEAGTAGATLAFGDLVYLAAADSRWELADASAASTSGLVKLGMCVLAAAADGDPTNILLWGKIRADAAFPTFTVSAPVYVSETAGDVTGTQPTTTDAVIRTIGFAVTADAFHFAPSPDYMTHT